MRVLFRADASVEIGTGHVMRCATLANALRELGAEVAFACRSLPGDLRDWLQQNGYATLVIHGETEAENADISRLIHPWQGEQPIDCLVVDHYGLDAAWERSMRPRCHRILVIDDLANRAHDCDILLDQNVLDARSTRYQPWVPSQCQPLLGPRFALLRPEFRQVRANLIGPPSHANAKHAGAPTRVLIFFGGSDPTQECFKALEALHQLSSKTALQVDLVAGASNPKFTALQQRCQDFPQVRLHQQVSAMAELMAQADITLGAGGTTTWERLCLGLPGIIIAVAENQVEISRNLAQQDYHIYLGESGSVSAEAMGQALQNLMANSAQRQALSAKGMALVDGLGAQRVANLMRQACP
jgi:UDP-2,4-diacetamido-2,4,6-trideoxy-beta-L-altropyranose hydrolase